MRQEFEMTQDDYDKIIEACKPVPMIALQCGTPRSPQENANDSWRALGERMGFDGMSVRPVSGRGKLVFTAEVREDTEDGTLDVRKRIPG